MQKSTAPLYDKTYAQHRCQHCRFLIWFTHTAPFRLFGRCRCAEWCFDYWDDRSAYWSKSSVAGCPTTALQPTR